MYLCPKCNGTMKRSLTRSLPPTIKYVCKVCGYTSKVIEEHEDYQQLPTWLMEEESSNRRNDES